jgi:hypothetical protein
MPGHKFWLQVKDSPPENRQASNDCLPYEKTYYLLVVSEPVADVSTVAAEPVSGVAVADVSNDSIVAFADVSAAFSVEVALSLHATKAPIAKTNKNFFIFELFEFDNNVLLIYTCYDKR